jgi:hypothetical protein
MFMAGSLALAGMIVALFEASWASVMDKEQIINPVQTRRPKGGIVQCRIALAQFIGIGLSV